MKTTTKIFTPLAIVFAIFVATNVIFAASWTAPTATPPSDNVSLPINTSATSQDKLGRLSVLTSWILSSTPVLRFLDSTAGEHDWRILVDKNKMRFMALISGSWVNKVIFADSYAQFNVDIRADKYCDASGNNCFTAADVTGSTGGSSGSVFVFSRDDIYQAVSAVVSNPDAYGGAWAVRTVGNNKTELCKLLASPLGTGRYVSYTSFAFNSPSNNGGAVFDGTTWNVSSADVVDYWMFDSITCEVNISGSPTFSWNIGSWGACVIVPQSCPQGIESGMLTQKTRTVQCQTGDGTIVADTFCSDVKPNAGPEICENTYVCDQSNAGL